MFSNHPRPTHRPCDVAQAQDYISSIPEERVAPGLNNDNLQVRHGLDQIAGAINPSATLTPPQQAFVGIELHESFNRYFYARETLGQDNVEFQLKMRLLQIATFVNTSYTPHIAENTVFEWLTAPITFVSAVFCPGLRWTAQRAPAISVLESWTSIESELWNEPLVSYERDPERFSNQIIMELVALLPEAAQVNQCQAQFLRELLRDAIHTYFDESQEVGCRSANERHLDRLRLLANYCASCTGR